MINKPKAWVFSGDVYDYGHKGRICMLCNRQSRYLYKITVRNNSAAKALVGPECCAKVHIQDAEREHLSNESWLKKNRTHMERSARSRRLKKILIALKDAEPGYDFGYLFHTAAKNDAFSPKAAAMLAGLLDKHEIGFDPDLIKVDFRHPESKLQLALMKDWQLEHLRHVLAHNQNRILERVLAGS